MSCLTRWFGFIILTKQKKLITPVINTEVISIKAVWVKKPREYFIPVDKYSKVF
jgi:hypothetical protein